MFALTAENKFHLYSQPTDMRKSFDSLSGLVLNNLDYDPGNGDVFILINKSRDKIKLLHWQGSGYLLYYKRLEKGTFELPRYDASIGSITLGYAQMVMIIDGLSIKNLQKRTRYTRLEAPERDDLKKVLCKENGIELIEFDYTEPLIESYIRTKLEKFMSTNGIQL